ncbi:MAG: ATP-binding protein [Balneolaceae bacterium]
MPQSYSLNLRSEFREVEKVPDFIEKIDRQLNLDEDLKNRMMLALSEAVTNAIVHGNQENREKKVFIKVEVRKDSAIMTVEDQGPGFDPEEVPDPIQPENLLQPGGRGLYLMEESADKVEYNRDGTLVTLLFNR